MTEGNRYLCNRVPETSRCNAKKEGNDCPAVKYGKICISPHAVKVASQQRCLQPTALRFKAVDIAV